MLEAIKKTTTEAELQELRKYGKCITVQPHFIAFSREVPAKYVDRIFELYDIWLNNYDNYEIPIGKNKVYDARHGMFKTRDANGIIVEYMPQRPTDVDSSRLHKAFFRDLEIKVKIKDTVKIPEEIKDKFDFISPFDEALSVPIVADSNLVYGNDNAPSIPNTAVFDLFFRALTAPQYIGAGHFSSPHEKISVSKGENYISIRRDIKGRGGRIDESVSIKISNLNFYKKNKNMIMIFTYFFQKLSETPGARCVYLSYKELVDVHIYDTTDGARRGLNNFYDYFHGNTEKSIPGVAIAGQYRTRERKSNVQKERDLVTGRDLTEGGQTIFLNPELDLRMFTAFTSFLPLWAYQLTNLDAFLLVRYIFYTARMKGNAFTSPEKADKKNIGSYKCFTLQIESIRDAMGLPAPEDVKGRKYKEKIINPIEKAIEDVEAKIAEINDPDKALLVCLTPKGTDAAKNIQEYLRCHLEIGIIDTFADSFIGAKQKHTKHVEDFKKKIESNIARNAAKKMDS